MCTYKGAFISMYIGSYQRISNAMNQPKCIHPVLKLITYVNMYLLHQHNQLIIRF